ncbi:hypothetical protein GCM10009547_12850 [Sporichthya brevicatena]|uniref:Integral membrane protein n=1 Tax=Sporichthya brevicatena TaxID=171442 RepID=A0ABN1GIJ4_9ACTN
MSASSQRVCIWSGVAFMVLFFLGFGVIAQYIPPPNPANSAAEVAERYRENANAIRTGMLISMYALVLYVPWVAALATQMKRIEGKHTPLSWAQLALGAGLPVAFFPALYYFQVAAFRPERSDEAIQQLNDMGWLPFTGIIYAITVQNVVVGAAVLMDKRPEPVFPRWYAYFCFWTGLLYCPASLDVYFKDGPLAWNGLFSWWLSLVSFFAWLVVTSALMAKAISHQEREESAPTSAPLHLRSSAPTDGHASAAEVAQQQETVGPTV